MGIIINKVKISSIVLLVVSVVFFSCSSQTKNEPLLSELSWVVGEWYCVSTNDAGRTDYEYLVIDQEFAKVFDINYADSYEFCLATSPTRRFLIKDDTLAIRLTYKFDPKEKKTITEDRIFRIDNQNQRVLGEYGGKEVNYQKVSLSSEGIPIELPPFLVQQSNYTNNDDDSLLETDERNLDIEDANNNSERNENKDVVDNDNNIQSTINESAINTKNTNNEDESGRLMSNDVKEKEVKADNSEDENLAEDNEIYQVVEKMPEFPDGGMAGLMKWLSNNIQYPAKAREEGTQGRVTMQFVVNRDGSISDAQVLRGVDPNLDKEALRLINSMPKWKPGMQRGKPVRVRYSVLVNFRL